MSIPKYCASVTKYYMTKHYVSVTNPYAIKYSVGVTKHRVNVTNTT
jgi:hypothetical protein